MMCPVIAQTYQGRMRSHSRLQCDGLIGFSRESWL